MVDSGGEQAYVLYGLENQMKINQVMPVRVMGYDFASYDREISRLKGENRSAGREADYAMELHQEQKLMPVLTLVLYFGMKPWTGPRSLRDVLNIPDALDLFMPDYPINVIQVANLPLETIEKFTSDFQIVARWFRAKRLGNVEELRGVKKEVVHVEELLEFFHVFAEDEWYDEIKDILLEQSEKGEKITMCNLVDMLIGQGMEKGIEIGMEKGMGKGLSRSVAALVRHGFSREQAMFMLDLKEEDLTGKSEKPCLEGSSLQEM